MCLFPFVVCVVNLLQRYVLFLLFLLFFFSPKLYSSRTLLISLLSNAVWSSKPKRTISMVRNGSGHSPEQQNKKNSISGWACCLTSTTVASEENKTLFRDYCRKQWVWRDAYLKTARLRDQSTSGFLSSNFARLFIRCRPPNIKAAYSAENRNDFFLQNKTKKKHLSSVALVPDK